MSESMQMATGGILRNAAFICNGLQAFENAKTIGRCGVLAGHQQRVFHCRAKDFWRDRLDDLTKAALI
ncbi:hypothetical protein C3408_22755 [Candidatus Pantoea alvi]|nr:hypothetical protein C3408_22755 [Pantoea alvi]